MTLPDARARVERIGRDKEEAARLWAHTGDLRELYEGDALASSRVLAELDRLPRLRETLESVEWSGDVMDGDQICPACRMIRYPKRKGGGHADNCRLTAALETP